MWFMFWVGLGQVFVLVGSLSSKGHGLVLIPSLCVGQFLVLV